MTTPICSKCNKRPGTEIWVDDVDWLGVIHGTHVLRCRRCIVTAQLEHAKKMMDMVPQLEQELAKLEAESE